MLLEGIPKSSFPLFSSAFFATRKIRRAFRAVQSTRPDRIASATADVVVIARVALGRAPPPWCPPTKLCTPPSLPPWMRMAVVRRERARTGARTGVGPSAIADITICDDASSRPQERVEEPQALFSPVRGSLELNRDFIQDNSGPQLWGQLLTTEHHPPPPLRSPFHHHLRTTLTRSDAMVRDLYAAPPPRAVLGTPWAGPARLWAAMVRYGPPTTPSFCHHHHHHHPTTTDPHAPHPAL